MKFIYDIFSSFEKGRNGRLLTDSVEIEGSTEAKSDTDFSFYLNNNFYEKLQKECENRFSNVIFGYQLQEITICIEKNPLDDEENIIDEDCDTDYLYWFYNPLIGLITDEKEAKDLLNEQIEIIRKEEEEERNF